MFLDEIEQGSRKQDLKLLESQDLVDGRMISEEMNTLISLAKQGVQEHDLSCYDREKLRQRQRWGGGMECGTVRGWTGSGIKCVGPALVGPRAFPPFVVQ